MLVNKRRNSDPAAGDKADLDITAPRQTEKTATEIFFICYYVVELFGTCSFFQRSMGYGDLKAAFRGEWFKKKEL